MESAEQRFGGLGEIVERGIPGQRVFQHAVDLAVLEIEIAVEDEIRGRNEMGVDHAVGAAGFAERDGFLGGSHHFIGSHHEIGGAGDDARTGDVGGVFARAGRGSAPRRPFARGRTCRGSCWPCPRYARPCRAARRSSARRCRRRRRPRCYRAGRARAARPAPADRRYCRGPAGARRRSLPPSMVTKDGQKPFRQE